MSVTTLVLAGCGSLDELAYDPPTTPTQWCLDRPCVELGGTVLNEPLGTALVALLTVLWLAAGAGFLVSRRRQRSRTWLGIALLLAGLGAGQAGISYQAFAYELKCAGWQTCRLTTGWEVGYSLTQAASVAAMLVAVAFACTVGRTRRGIITFAAVDVAVYAGVVALGVALPSATLLSFTVLMAFAVPGIVLVLVVASRRFRATRDPMDRSLVMAAWLLVAVQLAYFASWLSGATQLLWDGGAGIYVSENEVLHVGMILWLGYVLIRLGPRLRDREDVPAGAGTAGG
ncbi:MAG TPA: hypothetical protein VF143_08790 [Candidatus Nanopelagicales bacterium]